MRRKAYRLQTTLLVTIGVAEAEAAAAEDQPAGEPGDVAPVTSGG